MKRFPLAICLVAVLSVGCRDQELLKPSAPSAPMAAIMDGAHAGNPFFFFLPPLVPNPSNFFHAGTFNARLSPVVEVCQLTQDPRLPPNPIIECVGGNPVFGPARMALDASGEQYQLNWDTKASPLSATNFYRIIVRGAPRGEPLGFVDVDPVDQGMKNVRTGDVVAFQDGRMLPIKVRIEDGAFGSTNADDHVEQVVPTSIPTGTLDVTTNTGTAGARFSDGWLPRAAVAAGIDQVVVIIERLTPDNSSDETSCLRSGLEELEGCYRFRTDPDLNAFGSFNVSVIAGVCFEIPADIGNPEGPPFQLHRRAEVLGVLVGPAVLLEERPAPFLNCAGFGASQIGMGEALRSGRLGDIASAGWNALVRGVGRLVMPSAAYAIDAGAGGSTDFFSRFGYARRASMTVTAGNGAIAAAGSLVNASVHLQNTHHEEITPIAGQAVTYTITAGGGTLVAPDETEVSTLTVLSNEAGNASVSWRLGVGTNQIEVSTEHVTQSPLFIMATGTPLISTATGLASGVPLAGVDFTVPLEATVTPAPPAGSVVEFFEGSTLLGAALTNEAGQATRSVTLNGVLARQFFTARFTGTTTHAASTSPVAVQQKWQHFDDPAGFTAALGGAVTESQDFEGLGLGTAVSAIIGSVLNVTSSFPTLGVFECATNCLFGSGGDVRVLGNGQYDLEFLAPRNAIAFDLASQDPATGPVSIQIFAALTGITIGERNLAADESTPNFFGIILTVPIQRVLVLEAPEVGGSGNEEIGLDNFVVASVPFSP